MSISLLLLHDTPGSLHFSHFCIQAIHFLKKNCKNNKGTCSRTLQVPHIFLRLGRLYDYD
ncbi:MAG: hypothetical protein VR65_13330 [Desulfobulbaceae bacterium BRH_c16a]|nr:MAG: hypothetical protein VR65_13330 [Desulfobulbaceae bacterium BRH_c16a]